MCFCFLSKGVIILRYNNDRSYSAGDTFYESEMLARSKFLACIYFSVVLNPWQCSELLITQLFCSDLFALKANWIFLTRNYPVRSKQQVVDTTRSISQTSTWLEKKGIMIFFPSLNFTTKSNHKRLKAGTIQRIYLQQYIIFVCQDWPVGPLPDQSVWEWNRLFFQKFFPEKPSPSYQGMTNLAGEFWLKGKFSLRREWSRRSVLTNGKRP